MSCAFLLLALASLSMLSLVKGETQCYGDLGCYDSEDFYDSKARPIHTVPEYREEVNVNFYLFTTSNADDNSYQTLTAGDPSALSASNFNGNKNTKIIIHGYTNNGKDTWVMKMKNALLEAGDFNVISVDWKDGADGMYDQAAANTWLAGGEVALLISFLMSETPATPSQFHLMGHSLGSHVAGYAGSRHTNPKLGRITAMDPADPLFQGTGPHVRIDPTDASFVDAIHTDGDNIVTGVLTIEGGFGMKDPVGHIDFYPNGGKGQPGCDANIFVELLSTAAGDLKYVVCDHSRAHELMTDSINANCDMISFPCDNYDDFKNGQCSTCGSSGCGIMGFKADQAKPPAGQVNVKHYLQTGSSPPFCRRHFIMTVKISSSSDSEDGYVEMKFKGNNREHKVKISPGTLEAGRTYTSNIELVDDLLGSITEMQILFEANEWWNPFDWGSHKIKLDSVQAEELGVGR